MNKQFQKVVSDLELLVREDLVEHEDIRSFGASAEDNYVINPKNVILDAICLLKEYNSALNEEIKNNRSRIRENYNYDDWSGAQGNDSERMREEQERGYWGIYG